MESQRSLLFFGLIAVSYLLYNAWQTDHAPKPATPAVTETAAPSGDNQASQAADIPTSGTQNNVTTTAAASTKLISFGNDVLDLRINPRGGDVVSAKLKKFSDKLGQAKRFTLLDQTADFTYIAMSGLIVPNANSSRPLYQVAKPVTLADGSEQLVMTATRSDGVKITKTLTLAPGKYVVNTRFNVANTSAQPLNVEMFTQIKRTDHAPKGSMVQHSYTGAVYSTDDESYEKYKFDDFKDHNLNKSTKHGWVAMLQHYFVSAWAPKVSGTDLNVYSMQSGDNVIIGMKTKPVTVAAHSATSLTADLYVGPKDQDAMAKVAPKLEKTVDYGFLWFIGEILFWMLKHLHMLVQNWGFAIILLTLIVRGAMFPLTKAQYTSMAKMRLLQPKLASLKERFGDDRQRMSQAMMELYKKEGVNPLGGCFPILLQMPIFIALYWVLNESVELRHAPFMLWIHDLSAKDPFFVLPLLFIGTMWFSQKLNPSTMTDPMQQKVMQLMPILMGAFFALFPSGLVLYYVVSNMVSIGQQLIIYKGLEKKGLK